MRDVEAFASCQTADIIFLTLRELVALRDFRNDVAHRIVESQLETQHLNGTFSRSSSIAAWMPSASTKLRLEN